MKWIMFDDVDAIALRLADIAVEAGELLRRMQDGVGDHRVKENGTPTCAADLAAEDLILSCLARAWPGIPIVAEETANQAAPGQHFFSVDPLDGTADFLHGTGEYTVNIALIADRRPVAGVVAAPSLGRIWMAGGSAQVGDIIDGSRNISWRPARVRSAPTTGLVALVSRRHGDVATEACLSTLSIGTRRTASSAMKFCLIASGEADIYVRCGPTMEWDTAAGDHILTRAGGAGIGAGGRPLFYGREQDGYKNGPFAALGDPALAPRLSLPIATG
jgi:3'(2'), 5'-bisphosphate nucleotidase